MSYTQYQEYGGNPYSNAPDAEAGHAGQGQHLGAPGLNQELTNYSQNSHYSNAGAPGVPSPSTLLTQQAFLERVDFAKSEIRELSSNITEIASLHQRTLASSDTNSPAQLEHLITQTQLKNTQIRDQIKFLERDAIKTEDGTKNVKARQAKQLKGEFEKALRDYQQEEFAYKKRYREQIERQFRIVNPQATEAEVQEAADLDWGTEGVFQAALKSNRSGQASSILGAVRARHNELQRIEATLTDLAAMFADMAQIVEAQEPVIEHTERSAMQTTEDMKKANVQIDKAKKSAARARKLKWWCFFLVILIILALALGIGLGVGLPILAAKNAKKAATGS